MRAQVDGVLAGVGTVLKDDPSLNARGSRAPHQPMRIILDPSLKTPVESKLVRGSGDGKTVIVVGKGTPPDRMEPLAAKGVRFMEFPVKRGWLSWPELAGGFAAMGIIHIMVEGGGRTAAWFISEKAVQRFEIYVAPLLMGEDGVPSMGSLNVTSLAEAPSFSIVRTRRLDEDLHITADAVSEDRDRRSENR